MIAEFIMNHGRVQEKFHRLDWFPIGRALRGADIFCPVCWFLHSTALDIEPSPNPHVKFNPIEDQSTVLFRIIKSFTTKFVNLRFLLIFFCGGVLIIIIHVNHRVEIGHKPKLPLYLLHMFYVPQPRFAWHHGWSPPLAMIIILDVTGVNWHC